MRPIPTVEEQEQAILRSFDSLRAGEMLLLIDRREPRRLLLRLQRDRAGHFDWHPLETGPGRWRIEVHRRESAGSRNVLEYLHTDHHRLYKKFDEVTALINEGRCAEAAAAYLEFRCGAIRHLEAEEKVLFPQYEKAAGQSGGPTADLRAEHVAIRRHMDELARAIDLRQLEICRSTVESLVALLQRHTAKEERIVCAQLDRATGDAAARDVLVSNMQGV